MTTVTAPTTFTTARLHLRPSTLNDAEAIFHGYASDPAVTRYLTWRTHTSVTETVAFLELCAQQWAEGSNFPFVIENRDAPGIAIGMINLEPLGSRLAFGYVLAQRHWGHGLMSEALLALADWALAQPGVWRLSSVCDLENPASGRVMEKAGLSYEGCLRRYLLLPNISDEPRDCHLYARVKTT